MTPAFQFYPADWLSDAKTAMATLEEEGAFIRLLCYAWREGSIPSDSKRCASLIGKGASEDLARVVQGWFNQHPTDVSKLVHPRLEKEREKQERWREKSAEGGKKSAKIRQSNRVKPRVVEPPYQPNGNSSSSSSTSVVPQTPPDPTSSGQAGKKKDNIPTTDIALRIAKMFHRSSTTKWNEKEIEAFKKAQPIHPDDLAITEVHYAKNWPPSRDSNILRHDIKTFLNNFPGEVDRARAAGINGNGHKPDAPRGEFAKPFSPGPQKPQHVIDWENERAAKSDNGTP